MYNRIDKYRTVLNQKIVSMKGWRLCPKRQKLPNNPVREAASIFYSKIANISVHQYFPVFSVVYGFIQSPPIMTSFYCLMTRNIYVSTVIPI